MREAAAQCRQSIEVRNAALAELRASFHRLKHLAGDRTGSLLEHGEFMLRVLEGNARLLSDSRKVDSLLAVCRDHSRSSGLLNALVNAVTVQCTRDIETGAALTNALDGATQALQQIERGSGELDDGWNHRLLELALSVPDTALKLLSVVRGNAQLRDKATALLKSALASRVRTLQGWCDGTLSEHQETPRFREQALAFERELVELTSEWTMSTAVARHAEMDTLMGRTLRIAGALTLNLSWEVTHDAFGREASRLGDPASYGVSRARTRQAAKGLKQFRELGGKAEGLMRRQDTSDIEAFWKLTARRLLALGAEPMADTPQEPKHEKPEEQESPDHSEPRTRSSGDDADGNCAEER
ncbi:hypothetical protein TBR22_A06070 [Luteitalea sp. TBR-22]|uniref:hypothetical protein n=1 Tax=Luteitalea sp. TBR-22 TaxID=2802971 RepID=UPI001AF338D0|nr:hypothetical protein [Luteitalea sp. TBR-22]BCS31406.1 hypothetical protein TBR22_A06070 [Luteitalea sp. TBR-22]